MSRLSITGFAAATLLALPAWAAESPAPAGRAELSLAVLRDSQQQQQAAAALRLPLSRHVWAQVDAGRSRSPHSAPGGRVPRPTQLGAGLGVAGSAWAATLEAGRRRDGPAFQQTDWAAAADLRPVAGASVGVDATRRSARLRDGSREQRLRGRGVGLHGALAVGEKLTLHGAAMRTRYSVRETAPAATPGGLAGLLSPRPSALNREELAADRSARLGASWRFDSQAVLTGEAMVDRLNGGGSLRSAQLKATLPVRTAWTLAPALGRSHGPDGVRSTYGQLGASYAW